jgi:RimJ/RimL family protein N-acetyltransferase
MIELRKVQKEDCRDLYQWRDSPEARKFSLNTGKITYEKHIQWFDSSLNNPARTIYIALCNMNKIGQIRFDEMDDTARVSIIVKDDERGKGYGKEIIQDGTRKYLSEKKRIRKVIAEIKPENVASRRAFEKAGYELSGIGEQALEYMLRRQKYDAALILAHELKSGNGHVVLCEQTKARTDLGIALLKAGKVGKLIMTSDCRDRLTRNNQDVYGIPIARAMRNYAIEQGANEEEVIEEDISLDTAGELIFARLGILEPRNWGDIVIITNEWHYRRTKKEADFILKEFEVDYRIIKDDNDLAEIVKEKENKSLDAFQRTFERVNPENGKEILEALLNKHPFYNKNQDYFRQKIVDLALRQNNGN